MPRRALTAERLAYAVWLLPNDTTQVIKLTQKAYDAGEYGNVPGARWLMAAGGIPALDTADGWWQTGDSWEIEENGRRILVTAQSDQPDFLYRQVVASDPGKLRVSQLSGVLVESRANFTKVVVGDVPPVDVALPEMRVEAISGEMENHRSITFDACTAGSAAVASSVTFSHTVAVQSDRYIIGGGGWSNNLRTISSVTYAAVAFAAIDANTGTNVNLALRGLAAPATGANNAVVTIDASSSTLAGIVSSYYGVAQSESLGTAVKGASTTGSPTVTVTSATGEKVVDLTADVQSLGGTLTVGASQTERGRSAATGLVERVAMSDEDGAASVTMDWTHTSSEWGSIAVPLKPAPDIFGAYYMEYYRRVVQEAA